MSVNNIGPNIGGSSLLASYLEKQNAAPSAQVPTVQNPVQNSVQNIVQKGVQDGVQNPAGSMQVPLRTFTEQDVLSQNPAVQVSLPQTGVVQPTVVQPAAQNPVTQTSADTPAVQVENKSEKTSFISKVKEFFKNPKSKKIIIGGLAAAVLIAGITAFALLTRKKPQPSSELESALWEFVNAMDDLLGRKK